MDLQKKSQRIPLAHTEILVHVRMFVPSMHHFWKRGYKDTIEEYWYESWGANYVRHWFENQRGDSDVNATLTLMTWSFSRLFRLPFVVSQSSTFHVLQINHDQRKYNRSQVAFQAICLRCKKPCTSLFAANSNHFRLTPLYLFAIFFFPSTAV